MSKHTPTPWMQQTLIVRDTAPGYANCQITHFGGFRKTGEEAEANAARTVACVNAFHSEDGREIPTEKIEPGMVWALRDALQNVLSGDPDMPTYDADIDTAEALLAKLED